MRLIGEGEDRRVLLEIRPQWRGCMLFSESPQRAGGFLLAQGGTLRAVFIRVACVRPPHGCISRFLCLFVAFTRESGWFTNTLRNGTFVVHLRDQKEPLQYNYVTKMNLCSTTTSPTGTFAVQLSSSLKNAVPAGSHQPTPLVIVFC
jgi:hypothetical protein